MKEAFTLSNGIRIPQIGFGTYKATDGEDQGVILKAIECGYRHFDTASFYQNEEALGKAWRESALPREDFFLATKLWKDEMGYDNVFRAFESSGKKLGTDYLDLYLIHWPRPDLLSDDWEKLDRETWRALEELYRQGAVRAIGVCNFLPRHLDNLMKSAEIKPMVDQIEFHPGYLQMETVRYCKREGILPEAWSPIGRARVLREPELVRLAEKYGTTAAQMCIRFAIQEGVLPLPKSSAKERMTANLDVYGFTITDEDLRYIEAMPEFGWSGEHPDRERVRI